jgi:hypothetical protein
MTVRTALKEPAKTKASNQNEFSYNTAKWTAGVASGKTPINSLAQAGNSLSKP